MPGMQEEETAPIDRNGGRCRIQGIWLLPDRLSQRVLQEVGRR
jgi:hypothetical protein